jgi:hypothetical protein
MLPKVFEGVFLLEDSEAILIDELIRSINIFEPSNLFFALSKRDWYTEALGTSNKSRKGKARSVKQTREKDRERES